MTDPLSEVVHRHRSGEPVGITSVCSAHPLVLQAAVAQSVADDGPLLVEATSNQVDQFGGYTGLRPADFRELVLGMADAAGLPRERVVRGGDHLGPNTWRDLPAAEAMRHAETLVRTYAEAGFTKLHLDCSMACADDAGPPPDELVARRAARLACAAEQAALPAGGSGALRYVVGTEVPVPGGAAHAIEELTPTSPEAARDTLAAHEAAFAAAGVPDAWERVVALVVQPGVEFDATRVLDYRPECISALRAVVEDAPHVVFEAHSTDYQTVGCLARLVQDHWAVLKVGPGLTFALREALFALAAIEAELLPAAERSDLPDVVEAVMLARPQWWRGYHGGTEAAQRLARRYSYSDRVRYYWPDPQVAAAADRLIANLRTRPIPLPLLSAYLPEQYLRVRTGELSPDPEAIAVDRVREVLRGYRAACSPEPGRSRA